MKLGFDFFRDDEEDLILVDDCITWIGVVRYLYGGCNCPQPCDLCQHRVACDVRLKIHGESWSFDICGDVDNFTGNTSIAEGLELFA